MVETVAPIAFAAFLWWSTTGGILYLDSLPTRTFRASLAAAAAVMVIGFLVLALSVGDTNPSGAYLGFASAIAIWAFIEVSFLLGYVTGRRHRTPTDGSRPVAHFLQAIDTIIWHELLIVGAAAAVAWLSWQAGNTVGFWTFMILWAMRSSAKLNLHFGVRNLGTGLLPPHLAHFAHYLRRRPMNLLFPLSVTIATAVTIHLGGNAFTADDPAARAGGLLLATLLALGTLEHWLMVLPLSVDDVWSWAKRPAEANVAMNEVPVVIQTTTAEPASRVAVRAA
jgi:putative photosynthetic complex assembly protein 2